MTSWLLDWLDERDIRTPAEALRCLADDASLDTLISTAERSLASDRYAPLDPDLRGIVASRKLDLSGLSACFAAKCQIRLVDHLLTHTWHYFDKVVVEGFSPSRFLELPHHEVPPATLASLAAHIEVLFHLKEVGALDLLEFREKPHRFCKDHYEEHLEELGFKAMLDPELADAVVARILDQSDIRSVRYDDEFTAYAFRSPALEVITLLTRRGTAPPPDPQEIARSILRDHSLYAVGDLGLALGMGLPLALARSELAEPPPGPVSSEADVAIDLPLPFLEGVPIREILALRHDLRPEFEHFRAALVAAIRERLQTVGSGDPSRLAADIYRDFIQPSLADIDLQLQAAKRLLQRKLITDLVVSSALVAVGLLVTAPLLLGVTVPAAKSINHVHDYFDSRGPVEMADLYFLWKARKELAPH